MKTPNKKTLLSHNPAWDTAILKDNRIPMKFVPFKSTFHKKIQTVGKPEIFIRIEEKS